MVIKLIGLVLVLTSCSGLGFWMAAQWKQRLGSLEQLRRLIYSLKGEIRYHQSPLSEALEQAGSREAGALGAFFVSVSRGICLREGELLTDIWNRELEHLKKETRLGLTGEDLAELNTLGGQLGYLDAAMQEKHLELYLEQLGRTISYLESHQRENCRLYTSLGVMGGLFLALVMY